jgi:hypothetical protein
MLSWQLAVLPDGSDAVQVSCEVPRGKEAVAQLVVQLQLSEQVAVGVTVALLLPVHSTV